MLTYEQIFGEKLHYQCFQSDYRYSDPPKHQKIKNKTPNKTTNTHLHRYVLLKLRTLTCLRKYRFWKRWNHYFIVELLNHSDLWKPHAPFSKIHYNQTPNNKTKTHTKQQTYTMFNKVREFRLVTIGSPSLPSFIRVNGKFQRCTHQSKRSKQFRRVALRCPPAQVEFEISQISVLYLETSNWRNWSRDHVWLNIG